MSFLACVPYSNFMASKSYQDPNYPPARTRGQTAAYLLGIRPMPPPQRQNVAVAVANHFLDHQDAKNGGIVENTDLARPPEVPRNNQASE